MGTDAGAFGVYERHFGLTERPFRETLDLSAFVELPSRRAVLRRLAYGLEHAGGPVMLFGAPGSGKSVVARRLIDASGYVPIVLNYPAMPAASLMAYLAVELGALPREASGGVPDLAYSVRAVREALAEIARRGGRALLVVDDAHLIEDRRAFDALRLLLNLGVSGGAGLGLLLVGEPELLLQLPAGLADRLAVRCLMRPLDRAESDEYIMARMNHAGCGECPFEAAALAALFEASEGMPRRLNRLADLTLLVAAAEGRRRVEGGVVERVAGEEMEELVGA